MKERGLRRPDRPLSAIAGGRRMLKCLKYGGGCCDLTNSIKKTAEWC